jgi:hypothetical protein
VALPNEEGVSILKQLYQSPGSRVKSFSKFIYEGLFHLSNQAFAHFDLVHLFLVFNLKANARAV